MKLTDLTCKSAKPLARPYKLSDGQGLNLLVEPSCRKYWRLRYRHDGKEKLLALGVYPETTLAEAREAALAARKLVKGGIDPVTAKRAQKRASSINAANTFEIVAREWHANQKAKWSDDHFLNVKHRLETDIFPYIGSRPIADIDAPELLEILRKIEKRGAHDLAKRARQVCGQVFRYGIATGKCKADVAAFLKDALCATKTTHFAALEISELPKFIQTLNRNEARLYPRTRRALTLQMHLFVRPCELTEAKWIEFDLDKQEWNIPAYRMKMKRPHIVPLSAQVVQILKEQQQEVVHLNTDWVFPSQVRPKDPMSDGTLLGAIKRLGYDGRQTAHGFRAIARTAIREKLNYDPDVIECQLAHAKKDKVAAAYDRTIFLDKRRIMMQDWSNYLDSLVPN